MESYFSRAFPSTNNGMFADVTRYHYLNELREQFAKFENEVWNYDSLRPDEAFKIDLKLPLVLIELFSKLFRTWRDFGAFQRLLKEDLFRQINDDLNEHFGVALNHFKLLCDTCDRAIPVEKNDLKYSYELHSQDEQHQTVLNHFNYLTCAPEYVNKPKFTPDDTVSDEEEARDDFNGYIVITENQRLKCTLCEKMLIDEQEAIHHVTSWPHRLKEMQFSRDDTNYIVDIDGTYCCRLCRCKLPSNKQAREEHLLSRSHKFSEECHHVLKENETQVTLLNPDTGEFMCEACDVSGANWNLLLEHCSSRKHRRRASTAPSPPTDTEGTDFIVFSNKRYECLLCQRMLQRHEIAPHQSDREHVERLYAILNADEPVNGGGGGASSPNTSSGSDGYNDAFKNNDIYIEINLGDDDSEVFKCMLCNKSGNGLDNLDAHCLTPIHQKHKSHIEKVSKAYADSHLSEQPTDAILDVEDLYYCRVCDVLIENQEGVRQHTEEKTHVQSVTLEKVLNENRDCVSTLAEEPNRFYHCHLCSRSIDGDTNILGHCKSGRHTELLNMVKALSQNRPMRTI